MTAIRWLLANRLVVLLATAVVGGVGTVAWFALPIDAFPDVTNTQVMVLTKAPGLAAVDVEQRVSYPLEQVMRGLPRVTQVRSLSKAGLSQVVVIFDDDAETYWTRQIVFERLTLARAALPAGLEPELGPISTGLGEIFQYTLEGDGLDARELRSIQDWIVAPLLKPVRGVTEVNSFGGEVKQYQVLVRPQALLKYGLTVEDVVTALERSNANAAGGVIARGWEQVYLRGVGLLRDKPDLERSVIETRGGTPVYLADVADVVIGSEPRQGAVTRDGRGEVVAGLIIMLKGESSKDVVSRVQEAVAKASGALPPGVRLDVFYDRTSLIEACIATVVDALLEGGIFVILVLFLFVAELRTALIVVLSLPLTFLASFIVMGQADLSANLMSLGGLAFSVGMVVDASIVVVENVRRHLALPVPESGGPAKAEIVARAVAEVGRPVAFSVVIIAVILVPLFALQGIEGKMFEPLALTMLISLLVSLVVALTVVPVLCLVALRQRPEREFAFVRRFHAGYRWLLGATVRRPLLAVLLSLGVLGAGAGLAPLLGTTFMPDLDEGALAINVVRLPNASLAGSVKVATFIEQRLLAFPEVRTVVSKTGRAEISEDPMGPEQTDVLVMLHPRRQWTTGRDKAALIAAMQADLGQIPGLRYAFSQPIALRVNELVSGVKSDLAVKVFGPDLSLLKGFADRVAATITGVAGAEDVKVEQVTGMDQLDLVVDREAAARHGVDVATIAATIESALAGAHATTLVEGERRVAVVVRLPQAARSDLETIGRLLVAAPTGARVMLSELAPPRQVEAPAQVSRDNGMRRVVVEANVRGRDLGGFVAEVEERLAPIVADLPAGYYVEYGGQFENQERAMAQLAIVVPVALVLILLLLFLALGSALDAALVLLNLPFALVGGIVAVVAFDMPLSVSAAVAFVVLLGIAVQNGVVLVAFFGQLRGRGRTALEAVLEGADIRFRPLLMTALTGFIGHLPMLYATGSGADIQKPLAVVVMGGIVTSTLLTLLVLPSLYALAWRGRAERGAISARSS